MKYLRGRHSGDRELGAALAAGAQLEAAREGLGQDASRQRGSPSDSTTPRSQGSPTVVERLFGGWRRHVGEAGKRGLADADIRREDPASRSPQSHLRDAWAAPGSPELPPRSSRIRTGRSALEDDEDSKGTGSPPGFPLKFRQLEHEYLPLEQESLPNSSPATSPRHKPGGDSSTLTAGGWQLEGVGGAKRRRDQRTTSLKAATPVLTHLCRAWLAAALLLAAFLLVRKAAGATEQQ